jgi:hypothetical protein
MLYSYIALFILLTVTAVILFRFIRRRSKSNVVKLFHAALSDENSGEFASAILQYETALLEAEKNGYDAQLRNKIVEKLKVLQTITSYENDMHQQARLVEFTTPTNQASRE